MIKLTDPLLGGGGGKRGGRINEPREGDLERPRRRDRRCLERLRIDRKAGGGKRGWAAIPHPQAQVSR
jgi:hypothetical protein